MPPPQIPDLPHGGDSGDCGECCHCPQRLPENAQHSLHVPESAPGTCHHPLPFIQGERDGHLGIQAMSLAEEGGRHATTSSDCKSWHKEKAPDVPSGSHCATKPLPTLGSGCQLPNSIVLQAMPGKPVTPIGCSGRCEGDRTPQVTLCPGVPAPPAQLPGHGHARGDPRAATSHPQTQLPGAHGES